MKPKILVIAGPTAVGKSSFGVRMAKRYSGEVISADSMQIYRGMDIGTGKITAAEMDGVPHHLLSIVSPDTYFSVNDFAVRAKHLIADLTAQNKLPILVGGTGLYINALLNDMNLAGAEKNDELRTRLKADAERFGVENLHERLKAVDPASAEKIGKTDLKRIVRALEVFEVTGRPKSEIAATGESPYDYLLCVLTDERAALYERINKRVADMYRKGLAEEVRSLSAYRSCQSLKAIGYKETFDYLDGLIDLEQLVETVQQNTRHYAKRQLTYYRHWPFLTHWTALNETESFEKTIDSWYYDRHR